MNTLLLKIEMFLGKLSFPSFFALSDKARLEASSLSGHNLIKIGGSSIFLLIIVVEGILRAIRDPGIYSDFPGVYNRIPYFLKYFTNFSHLCTPEPPAGGQ